MDSLDYYISQQYQLLYFFRRDNSLSIKQNDCCRWLCIDDVVQSAMSLAKPWQLTMPHHFALIMPLLHIRPVHIIEFGLGGGNNARLFNYLDKSINHQIIESNIEVINCFEQYFNPQQIEPWIVHAQAEHFLENKKYSNADWLIIDIFQDNAEQALDRTLRPLMSSLQSVQTLSINLLNISSTLLSQLMNTINAHSCTHHIELYTVPRYKNKILHLISKENQGVSERLHLDSSIQENLMDYVNRYRC